MNKKQRNDAQIDRKILFDDLEGKTTYVYANVEASEEFVDEDDKNKNERNHNNDNRNHSNYKHTENSDPKNKKIE